MKDGVSDCTAAIELAPTSIKYRMARAFVQNKLPPAIDDYKRALELAPGNLEAAYFLGCAEGLLADLIKAGYRAEDAPHEWCY